MTNRACMKKCGWIMLIALLSLWLAGCTPVAERKEAAPFFDGADDLGGRVVLAKRPERIVSMNLSTDELMLDLVAPERIAGLSWWATEEGLSCVVDRAKPFPVVHSRSPEAVLEKQPDLVLTTDGTEPEVIDALREIGVPVFVSKNPTRVEEIFPRIEHLGVVLDAEKEAAVLSDRLRTRLARVRERVADIPDGERPIVIALAFSKPFGRKGMLFDDMCNEAGFRNGVAIIMDETGRYPISKEQVVALNPDIFLMPAWSADHQDAEAYRKDLLSDPAYRDVKAVRNGRLFKVEDRYRYSSSQYIVDAVEQLAKTVYPERFRE